MRKSKEIYTIETEVPSHKFIRFIAILEREKKKPTFDRGVFSPHLIRSHLIRVHQRGVVTRMRKVRRQDAFFVPPDRF